jgi:DNA-binding response OmpR family regulator
MGTDAFHARILIVDDQASNLRLLEHTLHRAGFVSIVSTTNPLEVGQLHQLEPFDLLILDVQMPRMNGFEVIDEVRITQDDSRVAILVITADPSQMVRAMEAGANGFLSKPFVLTEVQLRIRMLLESRMNHVAALKGEKQQTLS